MNWDIKMATMQQKETDILKDLMFCLEVLDNLSEDCKHCSTPYNIKESGIKEVLETIILTLTEEGE